MAEEEGQTDQEAVSEREEQNHPAEKKGQVSEHEENNHSHKKHKEKPFKNKCRPRIDQLALPARRIILDLYQNHAHHLEKERVEKIKNLLQELYAMTPGETERYFSHLKEKNENISRRKDIKFMLKKLVRKRNKERKQKKAYEFIFNLLKFGMKFAVSNPIPALVSIRLRNLSDIILEQLCDLRNVDIPPRERPTQVGSFFIAVADWLAIVIEYLYFGAQLKKNEELEHIENKYDEKEQEKKTQDKKGESTANTEKEQEETKPGTDDEAVLSEPLLVSEME